MTSSFWIRTVLLMLLFAIVAGVMLFVMRGGPDTGQAVSQDRTLFGQFVSSGGPIVWFILIPMSVLMVYLAVEYCLIIRRKVLLPADGGARIVRLAGEAELKGLAKQMGEKEDLVSTAVSKALTKGVDDWFRMRDAMFESVQDEAVRLMRRIEWMNLIGNVSPMVGLFGTVVGMIKLFNSIVVAGGQPQPAQLAGGISVALVTTFWGLLIAIPALAVYGVFRNRIEAIANEAVSQGEQILPRIRQILLKRTRSPESEPISPAVKHQIQEIRKPAGPARQSRQQL